MKYSIEDDIALIIQEHPGLIVEKESERYVLYGQLILNHEFNNIPLYDEYEIKLQVPIDFPKSIPGVWETSDKIPEDFGHWYSNGALCLGANCEIAEFIDANPTLAEYINGLLVSYLYTASYYKKYGTVPYGERSHKIKGVIEAYCERYNVDDIKPLVFLMAYLSGINKYRGHNLCPCGSKKRLRHCHGEQLLRDLNSSRYAILQNDAISIVTYYIDTQQKQKEELLRIK